MKQFENNIINIHKEKGKEWLKNLPTLVKNISLRWQLTDLKPVENLSFNYVLKGYQNTKPIILKINPASEGLKDESNALKIFSNYGAVKILAEDPGVILLEQAISGNSLKTYLPNKQKEALTIICEVTKRLHKAPLFKNEKFPYIEEWLRALDKDQKMPKEFLEKARRLKSKLLKSSSNQVLLHGDLHHDNILENGNDFVIIDPKGVIGYPINEVWAFIIDPIQDTEYVANYFNFNLQEVREWYFVHLALAACWNLEDNLDSSLYLNLLERTFHLVL